MSLAVSYRILLSAMVLALSPHLAGAAVRRSIFKQNGTSASAQASLSGLITLSGEVAASASEGYTTNAICRQYNCINPVVPGMMDLLALSSTTWQCQNHTETRKYINFCKGVVLYDIAVPNPANETTVETVVTEQDNMASTAYFYALSGMNLEPWQYRNPGNSGSECAKAIWTTVCNTYFPRAQAGCKAGEPTPYIRPCKNVCQNYLNACQVQCCDESVQCTFEKKVSLLDGNSTVVTGYADELGPSATCTGSGAASLGCSASAMLLFVWLLKLAARQE